MLKNMNPLAGKYGKKQSKPNRVSGMLAGSGNLTQHTWVQAYFGPGPQMRTLVQFESRI